MCLNMHELCFIMNHECQLDRESIPDIKNTYLSYTIYFQVSKQRGECASEIPDSTGFSLFDAIGITSTY
jgi:hypothetical protein